MSNVLSPMLGLDFRRETTEETCEVRETDGKQSRKVPLVQDQCRESARAASKNLQNVPDRE